MKGAPPQLALLPIDAGRVAQVDNLRRSSTALLRLLWGSAQRRWWWSLTLKFLAPGSQLSFLLRRQHAADLRQYLRVGNLEFHLNLRPSLGRCTHGRLVKVGTHRIGCARLQGAHLIEKRFVALFKAVVDLLDL